MTLLRKFELKKITTSFTRYKRWQTYCCDRKSRAACAQSFALWQQATVECLFLHAMSILLLLVRATRMYGVVLHAHPVRGESHI